MRSPVSTTSQTPPAKPRRLRAALALAALMAVINFGLWAGFNQALPAPEVGPRVNGVTYAPFGRADAPWVRKSSVDELMATDFVQLAKLTSHIRTYSAAQWPQLPALAGAQGLSLTLGAWLNGDSTNNEREISAALAAASTHKNVTRLVVGNETILKKNLTPAGLISYLKKVRAATRVPVSTAEPWHVWITHPELADHVDFITIHLLPYWEGVGLETAVDESLERLARVRTRFPGKPILIGEIGYGPHATSWTTF